MKLTFDELGSDMEINRVGTVVALNREPFNEYLVHVELTEILTHDIIDDLANLLDTA